MLVDREVELRALVKRSDTPFLGLLGEAITKAAQVEINGAISSDSTIEGYIRLLYRYPALFSIHLTSTLMSGMGQTGNYDLYIHIRKALQLSKEPTADEKEALWSAFRRAVLGLGLEVSPRVSGHHYMADTYLRQAGVPLAFADDLAEKMLSFAKSAGLPDGDDPEGIIQWQAALESKLGSPFSRVAQKAVTFDTQGFYTRCFIKVHESGGASQSANTLEHAMAKAFEEQTRGMYFRRAAVPYFAMNDGCLGVFVPAGETARLVEVTVDGKRTQYQVGTSDEFLNISKPLPFQVSIREGSSQFHSQHEIWEDDKANRLLLFTSTGRLKARGSLGMEGVIIASPGAYTALTRFCPSGMELDEFSEAPQLFLFPVLLHPGQNLTLFNGSASLTLQGEERPLAVWTGPVRGTKEMVEFNFGTLGLDLDFPKSWMTVSNGEFQVHLFSNTSNAQAVVCVTADFEGHAIVAIAEAQWHEPLAPGLSRILAEIRRPGEARVLLRTSVLFWNGLESVSAGLKFRLNSNPVNLEIAQCENFTVTDGAIRPKDTASRHLSLTFRLDEKRFQTLAWNAPGVFIQVAGSKADEYGTGHRVNRPLGSIEAVSLTSTKQIIVSASEPGELSLGDWRQYFDFSRQPSKMLPASFLASRITATSDILCFKPAQSSVAQPLLKLVRPHFINNISDKVVDGQIVVKLDSPSEIEAVRFNAVDVLSGQDVEIELLADDANWTNTRLGRARLMTLTGAEGNFISTVYLTQELWTAGAWTIKFDGRIGGIWGHLQNARHDQFAVGLISDSSGAQAGNSTLISSLKLLNDKQSLAVFSRVQHGLLPCYAESSWASMHWLSTAWRFLVEKWRGHEDGGVTVFIDMACTRPPQDSESSWMLQQHIGADLPGIFALPAEQYRKVNVNKHPFSRALRAIALCDQSYPAVFGDLLHPGAAMGFTNFSAVARGAPPKKFLLDLYTEGLRGTDAASSDTLRLEDVAFAPEAGDYLGPVHYRYVERCLEAAYENTMGGNEIRRGQAIGICLHVRRVMPTIDSPVMPSFKGVRPHVDPWPKPEAEGEDPEQAQRYENLQNIKHFLSLFALHCRAQSRVLGQLPHFLSKLNTAQIPLEACLPYLLQVGEAYFSFYLLLWELVLSSEQIS